MHRQATTRTRDHYYSDTGRVEPRGPTLSSLEPSTVTAQVCRSYRKRIVDQLEPDRLCAAVFVRYRRLSPGHPEGRQGEVGHRYGILLLATDAARRPSLNVLLCGDRLFQQYVVDACAVCSSG